MGGDAAYHPVKRRKGSRHDKTGCVTCRYRRKKCTENTFPTCGSCLRLNLKCVRDPVRDIVPTVRSGVDGTQSPTLPNPTNSLDRYPIFPSSLARPDKSQSAQHRFAMKYYISELANHFTVSTQYNSFLSDFLPMALQSPALCDSLLALSSSHISLSDQSYAVATLEAQTNAIRNLMVAINTPSKEVTWNETNAATCLALATSLISTSDGKGWYPHLQAAKHFITTARAVSSDGQDRCGIDAFKLTSEGQWILRNFAYHDIIGSVTLRRRPLLDASYLHDICHVVDSYLGVAISLLAYISQICILDDDIGSVESSPIDGLDSRVLFDFQCFQIEDNLRSWTCPQDAADDLASMAYAYRSVILILLYRLMRRHLPSNRDVTLSAIGPSTQSKEALEAKIAVEVRATLKCVARIPIGGAPEAALLFPLFIAGAETRDESQIKMIKDRLERNLEKRSFQNISRSLEILESLWAQQQSPGSEPADWIQILDASGEELVLT